MKRIMMSFVFGGLAAVALGAITPSVRADGGNISRVRPFGTDSYTRYFDAGDMVTIGVRGDGDTDLDLYVYCPCPRLLVKDENPTDDCLVRFRAPESGVYTIRVMNRGPVSNVYAIAVDD